MSRSNSKTEAEKTNIDPRTEPMIEEQIKTLAASYVPEWHFDEENPDIGTVLAKIFARQTAENVTRLNQVPEKYRIEFVNMLGISLLPAKPAHTMVVIRPVPDALPGVPVPKGTKLLSEVTDEEGQMVFETLHDLYAADISLDTAFMTLRDGGRIIPLAGGIKPALLPGEPDVPAEPSSLRCFGLFDKNEEGIEQNSLLIFHDRLLDVTQNPIYIRLRGCRKLLEGIRNGEFFFRYRTTDGYVPVESTEVFLDEELVVVTQEKENQKVRMDGGEDFGVLELRAAVPIRETYEAEDLLLSAEGVDAPAEFADSGTEDLDVENFAPFGDTLSLYAECYIGCDRYFSMAGSHICVTFTLSVEEHRIMAPAKEDHDELKIVKKKPKAVWTDAPADTRADEIAIEYFNGLGWKKLICDTSPRYLFAGDEERTCAISFTCPQDWQPAEAGAYLGRCLRLRLLRADNCYLNPCIHHYPCIRGLRIRFSYEDTYMPPQRLMSVCGIQKRDLTEDRLGGGGFCAFDVGPYTQDALYLGFTKPIEEGPVGLLFQLDESAHFGETKCRFSYGSSRGFLPMKVIDHTYDMTRSGIVRFLPPSDFAPMTLGGKQAYWIRITPQEQQKEEEQVPREVPHVQQIYVNAVEAANIETLPEEDFYLQQPGPGQTVRLGVTHILDASVWVNEMGSLPRPMMESMLLQQPDRVRAQYDIMGEINAFYVKWEETEHLDVAEEKRCYSLDRLSGSLYFGDGISADFPKVINDVAFKVQIRRCSGKIGNVPAHTVTSSLSSLPFVSQIDNPIKGYGGSDRESHRQALQRGANRIRSRRRLVCMEDYLQEIRSFSDQIAQVKGVVGRLPDGRKEESAVTFFILMRDFDSGSYSFHNLLAPLMNHLRGRCELTISPDDLHLAEPVYASVSVELWVRISAMDDGFEVQGILTDLLNSYLDPVRGAGGGGWPIGTLPKREQILMYLSSATGRAVIRRMAATVSWQDAKGDHEADLHGQREREELYFVCRSGVHRIHLFVGDEE